MREHEDTQAIFREINEIKNMMSNHIIETITYRKERDKVVDAHSDTIWDKDGKPGLATRLDRIEQIETTRTGLSLRLDRLEQVESTRKWTVRAIVVATLGGIADKIFHFIK